MATPPPAPPEPSQPKQYSLRLDRDDRIRVLVLRDAGFTYAQISQQLQISTVRFNIRAKASKQPLKSLVARPPSYPKPKSIG